MRIAQNWKEYKIIDTTSQEKLESWNGNILIRPDPRSYGKLRKNLLYGIRQWDITPFLQRRRKLELFKKTSRVMGDVL